MKLVQEIVDNKQTYEAWRHDLHAHPQTAYEETYASDFVAEKLTSWGVEVHRGLAKTGVVGLIKGKAGTSDRMIGLRADMDALNMEEKTGLPYASCNPGKMHGCGHDGHTTSLLAAASYLARHRDFAGTLCLIFQPAEEGEAGAVRMIEEGLFKKFPCQQVFGYHNWPVIPLGSAGLCTGPLMAGADEFYLTLKGVGGHGAFPHLCIDPVLVAAHVITALQSLVSRNLKPVDAGVVTVPIVEAGTSYNVIPESVFLRGTTRFFTEEVRGKLEEGIERIARHVAEGFGATLESYTYRRVLGSTINHQEEAAFCADVLRDTLGDDKVDAAYEPTMAAEDFAAMLYAKPGAFMFLGNGDRTHEAGLHNPLYDYNDGLLPLAASVFVNLVHKALRAA